LFAFFLGGETLMSSWIYAFVIPNLSRRILGEGALGVALVPLLTQSLAEDKTRKKAAAHFLTIVLVLGVILGGLSVLVSIFSLIALLFVESMRIRLILEILPIIIPYSVFICLTGISGAALSCLKKFFLPALTSLFLNVFLILTLLFIVSKLSNDFKILLVLALSVLFAGIIQFGIMLFMLSKEGLLKCDKEFSLKNIRQNKFLKDIYSLAIPGILGAGVLQFSLFVDKSLALYLGDYAVPALYYSDRIVFLTIGIFAVALSGVMLPNMSAFAIKKDFDGMKKTLISGINHIWFICVPAAMFTFAFRVDIVKLLFMRGAFDSIALRETSWALAFYATGIPFFASVKILLSGFYSQKKMKTPVRVSVICISINIVLNLLLMWNLKQGGIALATVISSLFNNIILFYILNKDLKNIPIREIFLSGLKSTIAASIAVVIALMLYSSSGEIGYILQFIVSGIVFVLVYILAAQVFKSKELDDWLKIILK
jgi:putative peptidoglycan lipid II flippase